MSLGHHGLRWIQKVAPLAEPTCNWQLSMTVQVDINVPYSHFYELIC